MGEVKTKKSKSKIMTAITSSTIRGIIRKANEKNIKKEDIVSLVKEYTQYILIFYSDNPDPIL